MPTFQYIAVDTEGTEIKGTIEAVNKEDVVSRLSKQKLMITSIKRVWMPAVTRALQGSKIKTNDVLMFSRQLSTLVRARLPLPECFDVLLNQITNPAFLEIVKKIREDIVSGIPLSTAFGKYPKVFSSLYIGMIKAGEASGKLEIILVRTARYLDSVARLKAKLKAALIYPALVVGVGVAVLVFIMTIVIPQFQTMYSAFKGELPLITQILIKASSIMGYCLKTPPINVLIFAIIFGGIFMFSNFLRTSKGREQFDKFILIVPIVGIYIQKVIFARFSRTLGILVSNGVPILESLDLVAGAVNNKPVSKSIEEVRDRIREGEKIAETLKRHAIFPALVVQMINVGEQTGRLGETLEQISEFYEEEVDIATSALVSLIEPALIIVLAGMVAVIVVALYLPIFRMYRGMKSY